MHKIINIKTLLTLLLITESCFIFSNPYKKAFIVFTSMTLGGIIWQKKRQTIVNYLSKPCTTNKWSPGKR